MTKNTLEIENKELKINGFKDIQECIRYSFLII